MFDATLSPTNPTPPAPASIPSQALPTVLLTNACSLVNKTEELTMVLELNHVDIAVVSETWFKDDTEALGSLTGYNCFTKNRSLKDCGGVCILIREDIPAVTMKLDVPNDLEVLCQT